MPNRIIKFKEQEFVASDYQEAIFKNIENGVGNMIIRAAAGSAKTTTIVNCINIIPNNKKVLFVAFNKDIVEVINQRIGKRKGVRVSTFHSLGFSIFQENQEPDSNILVNEYKYVNYIKSNIEGNPIYIRNIISLVNYSRYYLAFTETSIKCIADKYGITITSDEVTKCIDVLKWGKSEISQIDYTDMIWLPNVLNYTTKKYRYNWILIDEAQDTSIAEQKLIEKCYLRGCRVVATGDPHQTINIWCGSDEEAIKNFGKSVGTKTFILPISYRCPKKIVELARKYSDDIMPNENAIEGSINFNVSKYRPTNGDMVLCRTTAPLIELYLDYLRGNKKSYLVGSEDVREFYLQLLNSCNSEIIDRHMLTNKGLAYELYSKLCNLIDLTVETNNINREDAYAFPSVVTLYDAIHGILTLSEGVEYKTELKNKINDILGNKDENGIMLSTVHKAKGLETDNVYILNKSMMPISYAKKDWELESEKNLIYVAITRAKKTLNFIEEKKWGKNTNYRLSIKHEVEMFLNKFNMGKIDNISKVSSAIHESGITPIDITTKRPNDKLNKNKAISKFSMIIKK